MWAFFNFVKFYTLFLHIVIFNYIILVLLCIFLGSELFDDLMSSESK